MKDSQQTICHLYRTNCPELADKADIQARQDYRILLTRFIQRHQISHGEAELLADETLLIVSQKFRGVSGKRPRCRRGAKCNDSCVKSYAFGVSKNLIKAFFRERGDEIMFEEDGSQLFSKQTDSFQHARSHYEAPHSFENTFSKDQQIRDLIVNEAQKLPEVQKNIILGILFSNCATLKDLAKLLDTTHGALRRSRDAAVKKLRLQLKDNFDGLRYLDDKGLD